jgi:hypothetical protein
MEAGISAILNAHALAHGTRSTFHSRRMRMKTVKKKNSRRWMLNRTDAHGSYPMLVSTCSAMHASSPS